MSPARPLPLLALTALMITGCAASLQGGWPEGRQAPDVLIVLRDGVGPNTPEVSAEQRRQVSARITTQLERHLARDGVEAMGVATPGPQALTGDSFLLTVSLRRYTPGNAAARLTGQLFGLRRPGPEDAATLRAAYQLRDAQGRLMLANSLTGSSRRSWEDAVEQVCQQAAREVARALRETLADES